MLSLKNEKRALQLVMAAGCLVPVSAGLGGMLEGSGLLGGHGINMDSHFRYLSGLLFAIGIGFASAIPQIERHTSRIRWLAFIVCLGGVGRLLGFLLAGVPNTMMLFALAMELVVTPLICLWQRRLARRYTL